MQEHSSSHEHHDSSSGGHTQSGTHNPSSMKFSFNLSGVNWKDEIMDAIEIFKMNKAKIHDISMREKATSVGIVFIAVPQILAAIMSTIVLSNLIGFNVQYLIGSLIVGVVAPFLFIYAVHFVANKFFQGKGELMPYFRVVSYINVVTVLTPVILLLSLVVPALGALAGLVALVVGIWALVISYKLLMEMYKTNSTNTILTLIIAAVAVGIVTSIVNSLFLPKPEQLVGDAFKNALKDIKY